MGAGREVTIRRLTVSGLDSFRKLELLKLLGDHTVQNTFEIERLNLEIELDVVETSHDACRTGSDTQHIKLQAVVHGIKMNSTTLLDLDPVSMKRLLFGSLLESPVDCIISLFRKVDFVDLEITFEHLTGLQLTGSDSTASKLFDALLCTAGPFLKTVIPLIIPMIRKLLNNAATDTIASAQCEPIPPIRESVVNFRRSALFAHSWFGAAYTALQSLLTPGALNGLIAKWTASQSGTAGTYRQSGPLGEINFEMSDGKLTCLTCSRLGKVSAKVWNFTVSGLDSIYEVRLSRLSPPQASTRTRRSRRSTRAPCRPSSCNQLGRTSSTILL